MNDSRYLAVDADLEITHETGSRIRLQLKSGQGVIDLSDAGLLRYFIKNVLSHRPQLKSTLQSLLQYDNPVTARLDITVLGKPIARLDTGQRADFICRAVGLPFCRIRHFAFLVSLLSFGHKAKKN